MYRKYLLSFVICIFCACCLSSILNTVVLLGYQFTVLKLLGQEPPSKRRDSSINDINDKANVRLIKVGNLYRPLLKEFEVLFKKVI